MKKLMIILGLCVLNILAFSQVVQHPNPGTYGIGYNRIVPDSTLYVPTGCGVPHDTTSLFSFGFNGHGEKVKKSALYFDSCGHTFYFFDPSTKTWSATAGPAARDSIFLRLKGSGTSLLGIESDHKTIDHFTLDNSPGITWSYNADSSVSGDIFPSQAGGNIFQMNGDGPYVPSFVQNGLITPGILTWDSLLQYHFSPSTYAINYVVYHSVTTGFTLAPADPTYNRRDLLVGNSDGTISIITGTAAATPVDPIPNPATQTAITDITVYAGLTSPPGTPNLSPIYINNNEWTGTASTTRFNLNSLNNPHSITKDLEITAGRNLDNVVFSPLTTVTTANYNVLTFWLRSKATWANGSRILLQFSSGTVVVLANGNFGFNSASTSAYQLISIPLTNFGALASTITSFTITIATTNGRTLGMYLDDIELQGTTSVIPPTTSATPTLDKVLGAGDTAYNKSIVINDASGNEWVNLNPSTKLFKIGCATCTGDAQILVDGAGSQITEQATNGWLLGFNNSFLYLNTQNAASGHSYNLSFPYSSFNDTLATLRNLRTGVTIPTLNQVTTAGYQSTTPIMVGPSYNVNTSSLSYSGNGTNAQGSLVLYAWGNNNGTPGHSIGLQTPTSVPSTYQLNLPECCSLDTLATKAYARSLLGSIPSQRFGVSGEDASASQNRLFNGFTHTIEIANQVSLYIHSDPGGSTLGHGNASLSLDGTNHDVYLGYQDNNTSGTTAIHFNQSSFFMTVPSGGVYTMQNMPTSSDTSTYKPIGMDAFGVMAQMPNWIGGGTSYTLPTASPTTLGGVKVDNTTITIIGGVISATNQLAALRQTTTTSSSSTTFSLVTGEILDFIDATPTTTSTAFTVTSSDGTTLISSTALSTGLNHLPSGYEASGSVTITVSGITSSTVITLIKHP